MFAHHNRHNRRQHNDIPTQKRRQTLRARLDLPRRRSPPAHDRRDDRAAAEIQPARTEEGEIVARRDRVGRDVRAQRGEPEGEGAEEGRRAVGPQRDDGCRVPVEGTVDGLARGGDDDADEGEGPVDQGNEEELPVGYGGLVGVACEVGLAGQV